MEKRGRRLDSVSRRDMYGYNNDALSKISIQTRSETARPPETKTIRQVGRPERETRKDRNINQSQFTPALPLLRCCSTMQMHHPDYPCPVPFLGSAPLTLPKKRKGFLGNSRERNTLIRFGVFDTCDASTAVLRSEPAVHRRNLILAWPLPVGPDVADGFPDVTA